jgi:hypothetical protein
MGKAGKSFFLSILGVVILCGAAAAVARTKDKEKTVSPDDPTYRLFRLLDNFYGGRLTDFYLLADTYTDPQQPGQTLQHVLRVNYDKKRFFGRLQIDVRAVMQPTAAQLKEYSVEQLYGFGSDVAKFEKINAGPFGQTGDVYVEANSAGALASAPITEEVRTQYTNLITRYILPALEKTAGA